MPGYRSAAEARLEALEEGLGERDFGEEHEHLAVLAEALGDGFEIDFGLARAGDSVEQHRIEAFADRCRETCRRLALVAVELGRREISVGAGHWPVCVHSH